MSIAHFLIVGTNYHPEPKRELKAAQKDAQKIGEIFKDFSQQHTVISLIGEEATKKAIESVIDDLSKTSDPSDILIIYWAGHVERKKNHNWLITNNIKSVNKAETFGFVLENHLLSIDGFAQRISDLEKYKNKVFIFDTCYSESIESILSIDCISESITILAASRTEQTAKEDNDSGYLTRRLIEELQTILNKDNSNMNLSDVFNVVKRRVDNETDQKCVLTNKSIGANQLRLKLKSKLIEQFSASKSPLEEAIYYATQAFRNFLSRNIVGEVELIYFLSYDVWDGCLVYDGLVHGSIEERLLNFIRKRFLKNDRLRSKYESYIANDKSDELGQAGGCLLRSHEELQKIFEALNTVDKIRNFDSSDNSFNNPTIAGIKYVGDLDSYSSEYSSYDGLLGLRCCLYIPVVENLFPTEFWSDDDNILAKNIQLELDLRDYGRIPRGGVLIAANRKPYGLVPTNQNILDAFNNFHNKSSERTSDNLHSFDIRLSQMFKEQLIDINSNTSENNRIFFPSINNNELVSFLRCIGAVYKQRSDLRLDLRQGLHPNFLKKAASVFKTDNTYQNQTWRYINLVREKTENFRSNDTHDDVIEFRNRIYDDEQSLVASFVPTNQEISNHYPELTDSMSDKQKRSLSATYVLGTLWRDFKVKIRLGQDVMIARDSLEQATPLHYRNYLDIRQDDVSVNNFVSPNDDSDAQPPTSTGTNIDIVVNRLIDNIRKTYINHFDIVYSPLKDVAPIEPYITSLSELEGVFGSDLRDRLFYDLSHSISILIAGIWTFKASTSSEREVIETVIENITTFFNTNPSINRDLEDNIKPWPDDEGERYLVSYWCLVAAMQDIAIPVQRFRKLYLAFFEKYFGKDTIPNNPELNILKHPRFPLYKSAITSLYKRKRRDWLEILFYYALQEYKEHSVVGSLLLLLELEPFCGYRDDPESSWRHIQDHLEAISKDNNEQRELGLFIPSYLAHSIAFSDFPTLKKLWKVQNKNWQTQHHLKYFGNLEQDFRVCFQRFPLTYLLAFFEAIIKPNTNSDFLEKIRLARDTDRNSFGLSCVNYGSFFIKNIELNEQKVTVTVNFWLNNQKQENVKLSNSDIKNLFITYSTYLKNDDKSISWILCSQRTFNHVKKIYSQRTANCGLNDYEEYFFINACKNRIGEKESQFFSLPYYNKKEIESLRQEYYLSPRSYACLRLLFDLRDFYSTFISRDLKFSVRLANVTIECNDFLSCSENEPSWLFEAILDNN